MKNIISLIFISLLLAGCFATTAKHEAALQSWIGHTEDHLVTKWGVPNGVYNKNDGGKILSYVRTGSMYLPGNTSSNTSYYHWGGSTTTVSQSSGTNIALRCKNNFVISKEGRVTSWSYEGNNCVSK
jgi:hypothetical protein